MNSNEIKLIVSKIKRHYSTSFEGYKHSTIARIISRRMLVNDLDSADDYFRFLNENEKELKILYHSFLIGVTDFFRDREVFDFIEKKILPEMILKKPDHSEMRLWIPGCSTGQEAYSYVMLFFEVLEKFKKEIELKVLATDITSSALEYASAGEYKASEIENVPPEFLAKYFEKIDGNYKVKQAFRKKVVFIKHDITADLPFTKIDLISCRNLMIYLKSDIQDKIIQNFHKALKDDGCLVLGQSETTASCRDCHFAIVNNSYKIYRKSLGERKSVMLDREYLKKKNMEILPARERTVSFSRVESHSSKLLEDILGKLVRTGVIIDEEYTILYSFGNMEKYYNQLNGKASLDITLLARENIRIAVISGVRKSIGRNEPNKYTAVEYAEGHKPVDITVRPVVLEDKKLFVIEFEDCTEEKYSSEITESNFVLSREAKEHIRLLEDELRTVKEELHEVVEKLEASNEELKISNEKLFASNEELQSTNEEINTANEELYSMNVKFEKKIAELTLATNDLNNLIYSMNIATIFLDLDLIIRKYTPSTTKLFNIIPYDVGRPINHVTSDLIKQSEMMRSIRHVIKTGERTEREVVINDGQAYFENVFPYKNEKGELKGVIISYYDISELKKAQKELIANEKRYRELFENMNSAFALLEMIPDSHGKPYDFRLIDINSKFEEVIGYRAKDVKGKTIKEILPQVDDELIQILGQVGLKGESIVTEMYSQLFQKYFNISAYSPDSFQVAVVFNDITEQVMAKHEEAHYNYFKGIVSNVNKIAFWEMDTASMVFKPDDHWKILVGHPKEDARPFLQYWIDKVHPEDTYAIDSFIKFCSDSSGAAEYDSTYRMFNEEKQQYVWMHCVGIVTERDEKGYPLHIIGLEQDITNQKEIENELLENKKWLEYAQKASKITYFRYDCSTNSFVYPCEFAEFFGYESEERIEFNDFKNLIIEANGGEFEQKLNDLMSLGVDVEYDFEITAKGRRKYAHTYIHALNMVEIFGIVQDITERVEAQKDNEKLLKKNERLQRINSLAINSGDLMVWSIDYDISPDGSMFYISRKYAEVLGIDRNEKGYARMADDDATYLADEEGKPMLDHLNKLFEDAVEGKIDGYSKAITKNINLKTGKIMYIENTAQVEERYENGRAKFIGGFLRDITADFENRQKIRYFAEHDLLTSIYNRNYFETYVNSEELNSYTIMLCDIDGLKLINDAFGHLVGDEYLKRIAGILTEVFNKDALVARIGGDEFAVIFDSTDANEVEEKLRMIKDRVKACRDREVELDVSIGYEIVVGGNRTFNEAFTIAENIMYRRKLNERTSRKSNALETIMEALNAKTEETKSHCERLQVLASETLKKLGYFRQSDLEDIKILANVHDIGKITVDEEILIKRGPLSEAEKAKIMQHTEAGYKIIRNINDLEDIARGILYHHERFDGKGYTYGLKGSEIPLFAKIISVVDSYDAMTSDRAYRKAMKKEEAVEELIRCSGTQFDPEVVNAFLQVIDEKENMCEANG